MRKTGRQNCAYICSVSHVSHSPQTPTVVLSHSDDINIVTSHPHQTNSPTTQLSRRFKGLFHFFEVKENKSKKRDYRENPFGKSLE